MTTPAQDDQELPNDMAKVAAALYGALLDVPIGSQRAAHFTPDQAFTLVNTLFYQALKDGDVF